MKNIIAADTILAAVDKDKTLFKRGGITVLSAHSSEEIFDLHRARKVDLIITELEFPRMGGGALCASIRGEPELKGVSIILICENTPLALAECGRAGVNAVLTKPIDAVGLFSTASQMLMVQQRLSLRVPMRLTVKGENTQTTFVGLSRDLSVSGMLLESGRALQQGERLECSFTLGSRVVSIACVVARVKTTPTGGGSYGVKFLNLDAKTFVLIEHFIQASENRDSVE